jgi:hypothetical protein
MWSVLTSMSGARVENCVITAATGHLPVTESVVLPPDQGTRHEDKNYRTKMA